MNADHFKPGDRVKILGRDEYATVLELVDSMILKVRYESNDQVGNAPAELFRVANKIEPEAKPMTAKEYTEHAEANPPQVLTGLSFTVTANSREAALAHGALSALSNKLSLWGIATEISVLPIKEEK